MQAGRARLMVLAGTWLLLAAPLSGDEPLQMQLAPAVARAPAVLTIRVMVDAADENRTLVVVAESEMFYRASEVQIDGRRAAPLNVFQFRNLPTGLYQVTGVLFGTHGRRASVSRVAKVQPALGSGR